jgi:hypothetical protein
MDTIGKTATSVFTEGKWTKVVYHRTCVIKWTDKQIVLDSGGWRTATTKNRINQASRQFNLGVCVYQEKGEWFAALSDGIARPFKDGMTINR